MEEGMQKEMHLKSLIQKGRCGNNLSLEEYDELYNMADEIETLRNKYIELKNRRDKLEGDRRWVFYSSILIILLIMNTIGLWRKSEDSS